MNCIGPCAPVALSLLDEVHRREQRPADAEAALGRTVEAEQRGRRQRGAGAVAAAVADRRQTPELALGNEARPQLGGDGRGQARDRGAGKGRLLREQELDSLLVEGVEGHLLRRACCRSGGSPVVNRAIELMPRRGEGVRQLRRVARDLRVGRGCRSSEGRGAEERDEGPADHGPRLAKARRSPPTGELRLQSRQRLSTLTTLNCLST
jgi:hypothetical protein